MGGDFFIYMKVDFLLCGDLRITTISSMGKGHLTPTDGVYFHMCG